MERVNRNQRGTVVDNHNNNADTKDLDGGNANSNGIGRLDAPAGPLRHVSVEDKHSKLERGWRRVVRNFTPSFFAITMGTGIVSILLHNLPYNAAWIYYISLVFFVLNIVLFAVFSMISLVRYVHYPEIWGVMIRHPVQSMFLGTIPMGFATIVNMFVFVCVPIWGPWAAQFAWAMWWIDAAVAVAICVYMPFVIMSLHESKLASITAVWLLPVVSTIVAAATGGIVAEVLPNPNHALWTVITSYILWGTGVPLAMTILVVYFTRLTIHHLPPKELIVSVFLPLGPLGQGGFGIMQLGKVSMELFPKTGTLRGLSSGQTLYDVGFLIAIIMWGYGLVWFFFALASISRSKFPFNMGWWGFTFPIGVFAVATETFGKELPSRFFDVLGTILSLTVVILWFVVAIGTLKKAYSGEIFFAPCLGDLKQRLPIELQPAA